MSHKRLIWEEVSQLAAQLTRGGAAETPEIVQIAEHLNRLAREQFKANALQEARLEQQRETINVLRQTVTRQEETIALLQRNHHKDIELARHDLILALLPVVDGLEATLNHAKQQLERLAEGSEARQLLSAWVEGLWMVYQRLMDVLAQVDVVPIPALGQPFDPHMHSAVGVDRSGRAPEGVIVAEERRGYRMRNSILRYADVIVSRPELSHAPSKEGPREAITTAHRPAE
ncbi:MAG: nucleotide exchange factor GrpE [Ardenticatenia bacterium]|jgi:molecular chaperone GrpE|nr:MAG: nucleotide exchange factor GrpE [Ardenticatenia bacterium]